MTQPTWGLVLTVRDPSPLVLANIAWHRATGASEIHIYLDDPHDPTIYDLKGQPGVRVTRCTLRHWQSFAGRAARPALQTRRQVLNAAHAQRLCTCDWLIHIDADEFLWQDNPLSLELAKLGRVPIQFPVWERVPPPAPSNTVFDGSFLAPAPGTVETDGPYRKDGLLGHSAGKSGIPVRCGFDLSIHHTTGGSDGASQPVVATDTRSTRLLHFDGMTANHWIKKMRHYANLPSDAAHRMLLPHRRAQVGAVAACGNDPAKLRATEAAIRRLPASKATALRHAGRLDDISIVDQARSLGVTLALSPERFDAALAERMPEAEPALPLPFGA